MEESVLLSRYNPLGSRVQSLFLGYVTACHLLLFVGHFLSFISTARQLLKLFQLKVIVQEENVGWGKEEIYMMDLPN